MKFVVIGGDAAGMSAASRAGRTAPDMEVVVLEKTGDVSYSACGMPYNIAEPDRDIQDLVVRTAKVFREKQKIDLMTGTTASAIDPDSRTVTAKNAEGSFTITYDKLLIATGASSSLLNIPGEDLPGVFSLKNLADGRKIKAYIKEKPVRKAVIIGMGYIALEMAEALRANDISVTMIKPREAFLPWMHPEMAEVVKSEVAANGVELFTGVRVEGIEQDRGGLSIRCSDTQRQADLLLVAVGVKPNSDIAADAGLKLSVGDSIWVDETLAASKPDIYAAGDCADAFHMVTGEKTWIPLALRANRAGWAVADNVCGKETRLPGIVGTAVFKVFDLEVARTGLSPAEARKAGFDPVEIMIKTRSRAHAHPGSVPIYLQMVGDLSSGRLLGAQMVGKEGVAHRINAPAVALYSKMKVEDFAQTDLAYAPPFGPVWDPLLTGANQLLKKL